MKRILTRLPGVVIGGLLLAGLAACMPADPNPQVAPPTQLAPAFNTLQIVSGQTIYVPAYAQLFFGSQSSSVDLAVTLAIHNTDTRHPIIIRAVNYYDTTGTLIRSFVTAPVQLDPLATTGFIVEDADRSGGWGANFIVEWVAQDPVYEPIVEAIMVSTTGRQGISLLSVGRVLTEITPDTPFIAPTAEATAEAAP